MSEPTPALLTQVAEGAWRIRLPLPWALASVNAFLFRRSDGWLLLDCGLHTPASLAALEEALAQLHLDWRSLRRIVVSHLHPDHAGAAAHIRRLSGAPIAMQPREAALIAPREPGEAFFARAEAYLRRHGVPEETIHEIEGEARKMASGSDRFVADDPIDEGDVLEYAGGRLETFQAPGHSPALLCFYDRDRKILYSTDAMLERISPNIGVHAFYEGNPLGEYFDSLAKLEALDIRTVVPSHGEPFSGHHEWIAATRAHHRRRCDSIEESVRVRALDAWTVAALIWGDRRPIGQRRLAMAEAIAHLEFLARSGRVRRDEVDGALLWQAI
ncbi:MAG: MBL fold metallo-hydrolase [Acidobacteria bacterium]|nr:MBL fold metallo-hydrolase [Acidobacteriota bacterium]